MQPGRFNESQMNLAKSGIRGELFRTDPHGKLGKHTDGERLRLERSII